MKDDDWPEGAIDIRLKGEVLMLLPQKAIFWKSESLLLIADVHLGKAGHFRKNGLAVPGNLHHGDLQKLELLISSCRPKTILFLGDLFHSEVNAEWYVFADWVKKFDKIDFTLIVGNHDILPEKSYQDLNFHLTARLAIGPFSFTHEPTPESDHYNFAGHIHPGIRLRGAAKQGMVLPCFYFKQDHAILPAFGRFTGLFMMKKWQKDRVFAISEESVISLNRQESKNL